MSDIYCHSLLSIVMETSFSSLLYNTCLHHKGYIQAVVLYFATMSPIVTTSSLPFENLACNVGRLVRNVTERASSGCAVNIVVHRYDCMLFYVTV